MDAEKTGRFISELRLEKGMSVAELAAETGAGEKDVAKWEKGKLLPAGDELSAVCSCFGVSLNELLSGQRIPDGQYERSAEDNLYEYFYQQRISARRTAAGIIACLAGIGCSVVLIIMSGMLPADSPAFVICMVTGLAVLGVSVSCAIVTDYNDGGFVCSNCGKYFKPSAGAYIAGAHSFSSRYLKCPHCGAKTWCRKKIIR